MSQRIIQKIIFLLSTVIFVVICFAGCEERYADKYITTDTEGGLTDIRDSGSEDTGSDTSLSPNLEYIDPFVGTGGYAPWGVGSNLPGVTAPFGLVKVSPDTQSKENYTFQNHCSGYFFSDEYIAGFSNVHFAGTGVPDYGNLRVLPLFFTNEISGKTEDYRQQYKKESEYAEAGYYSVELDSGIKAELTATQRVAFHRYTFPSGENLRCILFDIGKTLPLSIVTESEVSINQKTGEVKAYAHQSGGLSINYGGYDIYFYGVIEPIPDKLYGWEGDESIKENRARCADGGMCGLLACYKDVLTVNFRIAASYTSFDGAKVNYMSEGKNVDFEKARRINKSLWNQIFRRVNVEGGTNEEKRVFYSALYHIFMMPTLQSDADGNYRGFDKKNHRAEWGNYYSDFSLWDTYRTLHPFLTLFYPSCQRDMLYSLLQMATQGGYLPKWALASGETNCMVGSPADIVIADSYLKGINAPYEDLYEYILKTALSPTPKGSGYNGRDGIEDYLKFGFVTSDEGGSVSKTMELSYADNALCNMTAAMNKKESEIFCKNRYNYRNHFSEKTGYFLAKKSNGEFVNEEGFDPDSVSYDVLHPDNGDFIEGTAHHYRWFAFYDIEWLIEKDGGAENFVKKLSDLFEKSIKEEEEARLDESRRGQSRRYLWMGNEPDMHYVYLFSLAGRVDLTCKYMNWIREIYFTSEPDGLPGNDDGGTLSAWYIFSALGFYPVAGTNEYILGCPLFDKAVIEFENGKKIEIIKEGEISDEAYPKKVFLDNKEVAGQKIYFEPIKDGAKIRFVFGN